MKKLNLMETELYLTYSTNELKTFIYRGWGVNTRTKKEALGLFSEKFGKVNPKEVELI